MKYIVFFLFSYFLVIECYSQNILKSKLSAFSKPVIDTAAINNWISLSSERAISNDGNYFMYTLYNQPKGSNTFVVQSLTGTWKRMLLDGETGFFSDDSHLFVFKTADSLLLVDLGKNLPDRKINITSCMQPASDKGKWLAFQLKDSGQELVLHNLLTSKEEIFKGVINYSFDNEGNTLMLTIVNGLDSNIITMLQCIDLKSGISAKIWSSRNNSGSEGNVSSYNMDRFGNQVAFVVHKTINYQSTNMLCYYKKGMDQSLILVDDHSPGIEKNMTIAESGLEFSNDGRYILFQLSDSSLGLPLQDAINLDVWSYSDTVLQSTQLFNLGSKIYRAAISTAGNKIILLTRDYEYIKALPTKGDFVVVSHNDEGDRFWLHQLDSNWLISMKDGSRRLLPTGDYSRFWFSPNGQYLVYYTFKQVGNYFSKNLSTDKIVRISGSIMVPLNSDDGFSKGIKITIPVGIAGWTDNDRILVYDNFDIWQLDPAGNRPAVNITNGYGLRHHVKFRLLNDMNGLNGPNFSKNGNALLLMAFNLSNKYNGFYEVQPSLNGSFRLLTMGPWTLDHEGAAVLPVNADEFNNNVVPMKARDANSWIVLRQTATAAPNYFLTHDFKRYDSVTNLQPQAKYNWLKTELINWRQLDGTTSQGILYKPENFDPKKRYPVLFTYYQQFSHRLYEYPIPDYTRNSINIPWFVSRGYLVFTPDIYYKIGKFGQSVYNTIISAALLLSKLPYVDARHMGINGHSFGGFETNYLITHSHIFAAALDGAGVSDDVSSALELSGIQGTSRSSRLGNQEAIMGATIWQRPELYEDNSPILHADKVTTPLLIFHSKDDTAVPWEQGVEFFIALRRLGKKVWMLQYDGQPHGNWGKAAEDFTIRITQFFDHYLMSNPAPIWMTTGIPARLRGVITGYGFEKE